MTWTVTPKGSAVAAAFPTPVASLALTGLTIAAGSGVAVFVQYTDFQADTTNFTVVDSASNSGYGTVPLDSIVDAGTGEGLASFYNLSLGTGLSSGSITASYTSAIIQSIAAIVFTNSVAGTPTLDGHSGLDNTTSATTANSGAANSTNGDLVLSGWAADASPASFTPILAITGVASPAIQNNATATADYADGSGVTTTGGAASVTSSWSNLGNAPHVVLQMIFKPPSSSASCGSLALMGVGCSIGWRAALMGGVAAWRAGKAIERNESMTRRGLIMRRRRSLIGHNGGPALDE